MQPRSLFLSIFMIIDTLSISVVLAGPALNVTFPTQPPASALANIIEDHFIGISYELSSFDTLCESLHYPQCRVTKARY
jgi:hypothetical protein